MTHDPLCPIGQMKDSPGIADLMESGWKDCFMCKVIAAADARGRGHERDEAAQRIITALTDRYVHNWDKRPARGMAIQVWNTAQTAVAAARGQQS